MEKVVILGVEVLVLKNLLEFSDQAEAVLFKQLPEVCRNEELTLDLHARGLRGQLLLLLHFAKQKK